MTRHDRLLVFSATVTLAVAIGANTTIFSVANSILVRPLPYPDSGRIDWISERSGPRQEEIGAAPDYYRIRDSNRVFEEVAMFSASTLNWTGVERPEQLGGAYVSPSFFGVMGMRPLLGRFLAPGEVGSKAPPVVVLSYTFWRNRMGGDPNILGKTILVDRAPLAVIGVMPQGFSYPRDAQMWLPLGFDEAAERVIAANRPIFSVSIIARRKPGVSAAEVKADLNRMAQEIRAEYQVFATKFRTDLSIAAVPLQRRLTGDIRPALLALSGAAGLVLLIACVNLANMLLARAGSRRRDVAIRLALGAARARIVRQGLASSFALAAPGGLAGLGIAWTAVSLLNRARPAPLLPYPPVSVDWLVLGFTLLLTVSASVVFGVAPAFAAARVDAHETLKSAAVSHSGSRGARRLRQLLVVAELGTSVALLAGASLLGRSFLKLAHTELGFRPDHLLTFRVNPIGPFDRDNSPFYHAVLDRLQQLPIARHAAMLTDIPLSGDDAYGSGHVRVDGRPFVPFSERPMVDNTVVSPEYFSTLEIPLKTGRVWDSHDAARGRSAVRNNWGAAAEAPIVVNETLVRKIFPGEDPIGRRLIFGPDANPVRWTIIGVVGDVRGSELGAPPSMVVYQCACDGSALRRSAFVVRTTVDPLAALRAVEAQVHAVDRDLPVFRVRTMDQMRDAALAPEQLQLSVLGCFALIAMLLAAAGVYGVVSYLVTQRTREIGIRVAVGASPADVRAMVLGEMTRLAAPALALGLGLVWAVAREIDPVAFTIAPATLALVVLAACAGPARRASRIDPMAALREQ